MVNNYQSMVSSGLVWLLNTYISICSIGNHSNHSMVYLREYENSYPQMLRTKLSWFPMVLWFVIDLYTFTNHTMTCFLWSKP